MKTLEKPENFCGEIKCSDFSGKSRYSKRYKRKNQNRKKIIYTNRGPLRPEDFNSLYYLDLFGTFLAFFVLDYSL